MQQEMKWIIIRLELNSMKMPRISELIDHKNLDDNLKIKLKETFKVVDSSILSQQRRYLKELFVDIATLIYSVSRN